MNEYSGSDLSSFTQEDAGRSGKLYSVDDDQIATKISVMTHLEKVLQTQWDRTIFETC